MVPPDGRVFLERLTRLDPAALVRLLPADAGRTALWARLPWRVLVTREVEDLPVPGDVVVGAAALLAASRALPRRQDAGWRWLLPPGPGDVIEEVPGSRLREVATAAAGTLREVTTTGLAGRPVGVRALREAMLDHVAIVVEPGPVEPGAVEPGAVEPGAVEVPQRLVQAVVRMGFLGSGDEPVRVRWHRRWTGLAARHGTAWLQPAPGLAVRTNRA